MVLFVPITYIKLQQGMFPMKLTALRSAILLSLIPTTSAFAAGLDRSGQSIAAFLQPGNYFEAGISILDPEVKGKDTSGNQTGDMASDYYFPHAALKIQATDHFSVGLIYDQPFGAEFGPAHPGNHHPMCDAANFTEQEQWELDNEDPIMGLWRMRNEARAAARAAPSTAPH